MLTSLSAVLSLLLTVTVALPSSEARAACNTYAIISTRGTGELQGPSAGFISMISQTLSRVSGGTEYDTVYAAAADQISTAGTSDILRYVRAGLSSCPSQKYVLLGYSQGSAATVNALKQLTATSAEYAAIHAVVLIGSPEHLPGKKANVDQNGGTTTASAYGISALLPGAGIPAAWDNSGKVMGICYFGDGVCSGYAITAQHLLYGSSTTVQSMGANFIAAALA